MQGFPTRIAATDLRTIVERVFAAFETLDLNQALPLFADDALVIDPHYPSPRMVGKAAITDGLRWGLSNMKKMSFPIVHYFEDGSGQRAVVEVDTHHVLKTGMKLNFPQVFVIEACDGTITRLQAYEPYGPGGAVALILGVTRLAWRIQGRKIQPI